ncbi:lipocalin-like domain-containing protein [Pseudoalteromonas piscicida]|uniref:ABC transporter n=1 Tax=Pseudoalteromonas piscicida TaxID=43662 RepID=A0A2A5JU84_PSEO7|nr:lipocalin-like domain-containing protein [Pseudoalteromonas piscicida]PCK32978.1 ABC transporter [Pseudoalteromonas piscicida]
MKNSSLIAVLLCLLSAACIPEPSKSGAAPHFFSLEQGEPVSSSYQLDFPRDHGSHPAQGIEWWYVTANLKSETGQGFGVQWTLFRTSIPNNQFDSQWWDNQIYFAHFAIQSDTSHQAFERYGRAGQVQIQAEPFVARLDNWYLKSEQSAFFPLALNAGAASNDINLVLDTSPLVLHGNKGYSVKTSDGHASMYYSYPFLTVTGTLVFQGQSHQVTGDAWLDREWSSSFINQHHKGWDWFSIRGEDKREALMVFCIRDQQQTYKECRGTEITKAGKAIKQIPPQAIQLSVLTETLLDGVRYPTTWQLELQGRDPIIIDSINKDARNQLTVKYWEGRVRASGGFIGEGYAELVGYE